MGTQHEIVQQIHRQKADYILTLKANHPTMLSQVKQWFSDTQTLGWNGIEHDDYTTVTKGHHPTAQR